MSQHWTISVDDVPRQRWDAALNAVPAAYQQDWSYGEAMRRIGADVMRVALHDPTGNICGLAQFIVRPFALIAKFALCTYGPVWVKPLSEPEQQAALGVLRREMKLRWPRLITLTPDAPIELKKYNRVMTGDATVRLDLTQDEETLRAALDGKWRNRLVAAEKSNLKFTSAGQKAGQYQWLLEEERKQRTKKGYHGLPPALVELWQDDKARAKGADKRAGLRIFRADFGKDAAGAMMFLTHGAMTTYHIGWSSDDGRKAGAHNLILWNAMLALKAEGYSVLDLGGVNTASGAGIARFKLGTGGEIVRRPGSFV
ncbi:GNAT family N-acetyltransferase [Ponticaulis sp.]|uniref:lipid II:glycine glycyltransferase FemX n=1 Tax=Ponticaulis sp. TaxID=2020902 RepID=UPI000B6A69AE|nr:GNAT family N-acetyltransferase [Ponticaulis sp.]MAI88886.1 FemAB family protein [Ponticaulis sp.]OUY01577.1 MAG: FemAB family protein [Hyphomonadaceae bacterium TMED5]|tara:strand:+ start:8646 stop:9584 length:939 start_codon:yes stop_codon:yes gene_type:complete